MYQLKKILLLTTCLLLSSSLFADESSINITNGWIRETPPGVKNAAAFLTLNNTGNTAKKLTGVQCQTTVAARCELHEHIHSEKGMLMQKVTTPLTVPANGKLAFAPGGYHIMLFDLTKPLLAGSTAELIFQFEDQSTYRAQLPVKPVSQE